jgi:hypothetical protein
VKSVRYMRRGSKTTHKGHLLGDGHLEGRMREPSDRLFPRRPKKETETPHQLNLTLHPTVRNVIPVTSQTRLVSVVHGQGDTGSFEIVDVHNNLVAPVSRGIGEFKFSRPRRDKVGGLVLSRPKVTPMHMSKGISRRYETRAWGGRGRWTGRT